MNRVFLVGYERETPEEFLEKIKQVNIKTVIDVREIPLSRRNGFSKSNLQRFLRKNGINYYHLESLGSPTKLRIELRRSGDYLTFFKAYRHYLNKNKMAIKNLLDIISTIKHPALLCYERDCELCHRSIIASELMIKIPHLQVTPL